MVTKAAFANRWGKRASLTAQKRIHKIPLLFFANLFGGCDSPLCAMLRLGFSYDFALGRRHLVRPFEATMISNIDFRNTDSRNNDDTAI
jgi:hypothetical protein